MERMKEGYYKSKNRLTFKRSVIEQIDDDGVYINEIESLGIFKISKKDFYKYFNNVVSSKSYLQGNYNYSNFPLWAKKFLSPNKQNDYLKQKKQINYDIKSCYMCTSIDEKSIHDNSMPKNFYDRIKILVKSPINENLQITKGTTPIPFFGDLEKSFACTISLNPSDREFYNSNGVLLEQYESRLCSRKALGKNDNEELSEKDVNTVLEKCNSYFKNNPYRLWFDKIEIFLKTFDSRLSYYAGTVVNLDLVQWATTPKWDDISDFTKKVLLTQGLPFLKDMLLQKNFEYIFLNGKTAFYEVIKHLHISYKEIQVNDGKNNFTVYLGKYNKSNVIGWSIYLQSAKGGGYDNIRKISYDVSQLYRNYIIT